MTVLQAILDAPTDDEFRAVGFTATALNYPLSERAFAWLCRFNGVEPSAKVPRAWKYAPNAYMLAWLERAAR